jgi:hypothetical protein
LQLPSGSKKSASEIASPLSDTNSVDDEWRSGLSSRPPPPLDPIPAPARVAVAGPTPIPPPAPLPVMTASPLPVPLQPPAVVPLAIPTPRLQASADTDPDDRFSSDRRSAPLELAQLEPTPRVFPAHLRQRVEGAGDAAEAELAEPPRLPPAHPPGPPPAPPAARSASQRKLDLGLGSVPPLPAPPPSTLRAATPSISPGKPPAPPPPAPAARPRPGPADSPQRAGHKVPSGTGFPAQGGARAGHKVPSGSTFQAQLSTLADVPNGADLEVVTPGAGDPYWSAKRRAQLGGPAANPQQAATGAVGATPSRSLVPAADREARPRVAEAEPASSHRPKIGALGIILGLGLIALSARLEHSIFTGSANVGWALLQGLALYAVLAGAMRLRK